MTLTAATGRWSPRTLALGALLFMAGVAHAATRVDVYSTSVAVPAAAGEVRAAAYVEALRRVLVRATGLSSAATDAALIAAIGDPGKFVQQFQEDGNGNLRVRFDGDALAAQLRAAGYTVWPAERAGVVVWLAWDAGGGDRDVLGASTEGAVATSLRRDLLATADWYGVPVVLPLRDSQEMAQVAFTDVWGDFTAPVTRASERYDGGAILIGRARLFPAGMPDVRWSLLVGGDRLDWRGGPADGPAGAAQRLAARAQAAASAASGLARVALTGLQKFDDYARALKSLQSLDTVSDLRVAQSAAGVIVVEVSLRSDLASFLRSLSAQGVLETVATADAAPADGNLLLRLRGQR